MPNPAARLLTEPAQAGGGQFFRNKEIRAMNTTHSNLPIEELRAQMIERRKRLEQEVRDGLAAAGGADRSPINGQAYDKEDESQADVQTDLTLADIRRDEEELNDIAAALERMDDGSYGICTDCGESVPLERLRAYPQAKRCVECQERHERGKRAFPSL
jgi:RNA polymerase-binding protein DksA